MRRSLAGGAVLMMALAAPGWTPWGETAQAASQRMEVEAPEKTHWQGGLASVHAFTTRVLRDDGAWRALWGDIGREAPPLPAGYAGLAVFLGTRTTGGYSVAIGAPKAAGNGAVIVPFTETGPGDGPVTMALTAPWAVALVPADELPGDDGAIRFVATNGGASSR